MTNAPYHPKIDLQEATTRSRTARRIVAHSFPDELPGIVRKTVETALDSIPALAAEIVRLSTELRDTRIRRANLAAAARATLAAHHDGEPDPLAFLRDELEAQGYAAEGRA
ncbi:hypothetical protein [Actinomadura opuntiae]|uniref:hypothetical protein n=1 Tax=Actinomadura sp. OS1-43 TaxID=604315 RepID=UPI00255ADCC6|nr:hypothetical protein [Actinomadura sp. OS1-43]MDL4817759.1 hypothetical protein [Actinomadura sp. OS1-43]